MLKAQGSRLKVLVRRLRLWLVEAYGSESRLLQI